MKKMPEVQSDKWELIKTEKVLDDLIKDKIPPIDVEKLAIYLHSKHCSWNHTDGCGWEYEVKYTSNHDAVHDWKGGAHHMWKEWAEQLLDLIYKGKLA